MQHAPRTPLSRALTYAGLATLLGVVALTLSQCTMVGDSLTGVEVYRGRPTTCIKQCNDLYRMIYDEEQKAHDEALLLCHAIDCMTLPAGEQQDCIAGQQACIQAESARHSAKKDEITAGKINCQNGCHSQGTGSAG